MMRRRGDERGETLIELLITIAIMASAIVAIVAAIAAASTSSGEHKKQVALVVVVRNYAEAIMNGSYHQPNRELHPAGWVQRQLHADRVVRRHERRNELQHHMPRRKRARRAVEAGRPVHD
jgi:type II secretory pathway pseudopilin PulG